jgi:hypothetical protein
VCEDANLSCSVYKYLEHLEKHVISRHGIKGGRFIDGMYTCAQSSEKITGITMISDVGISLDHMLVINKINLGIENYEISKNHED